MTNPYTQRKALTAFREGLLLNGYVPLPAKGKRVLISGWTSAQVDSVWLAAHIGFPNTGIRCDRLAAIDIDCDTPGVTPTLSAAVQRILGPTPCVRVRGSRVILLYATDEDAEGSASTPRFRDDAQRTNRVEVLRGRRRQFIAAGMHPSGEPYQWPDKSPMDVPRDQLPRVTADEVRLALDAATDELAKFEGLEQLEADPDGASYTVEQRLAPGMKFTVVGPPGYEGVLTVEAMSDLLESMGETGTLQCNLDGVRPSSDSRAGLARLVAGKLYVTDFVKERVYTLPPDNVPLGEVLKGADLVSAGELEALFPSATGPVLGRRFFCEATGKGHDPDRPEVGYDPAATKRAFGSAAYDAWIGSCRRVVDFTFEPGGPAWLKTPTGTYYNTYRDPQHPAEGGEVETWVRFLEHLIPDADERVWFEGWLAHKAQHPEQKGHGVILVAHNVYGAGRGTLFEILRKVFGTHNTRTVDFSSVTGRSGQAQYNDWISRTLWVFVPEVKEVDPYAARSFTVKEQAYEALKEVADPTVAALRIKEKYGGIREEKVYANLLAATNHRDALALPAGDRRFAVLENGGPLPTDQAVEVHTWLRDPANIGALWRRLRGMKTDYVPAGLPPRSAAKRAMVAASASDVDLAVEGVRQRCRGRWVTLARAMELARKVAEDDDLDITPGAFGYLRRVLKREFTRYYTRVRANSGQLVWAYATRGDPWNDRPDAIRVELALSEEDLSDE